MSETAVILTLKKSRATTRVEGTRVTFSPHQCFAFDNGPEDVECLHVLSTHLLTLPGLALYGTQRFIDYLFRHCPGLKTRLICIAYSEGNPGQHQDYGIPIVLVAELPSTVQNIFLCETLTLPRAKMRKQLPGSVNVVEPNLLAEIAPEVIPARGWSPLPKNIYPIDIPEIQFKKNVDLIIVDCPSRNLALMPNGLGYLNNALKKTSVSYQIFDLDIVTYHRYHVHRLFDMGGRIVLPSGRVLPEDPWLAEHYDVWTSGSEMASSRAGGNEVLSFFRPIIDETIAGLIEAQPKILGFSIQGCNEAISREIVRGVKARLPDTVIVVGGFSCYNADIGRRVFPECDYMCVGEADLTAGPLLEALARGERPCNQPGVLSRFDTPEYRYIPAPMVHNLDHIEFPKYEWCDLSVYRNFNDYQLTPIIASRGCRWSRCTFCAERFYWRIRTPQNFVDELEWLVDRGCYLFMFNESDLGGMPERVMEICDEIIRRGLHRKVKLTGQLRVNKKQNRAFFEKLREANFVALRFGVDAFSENTLRLQKKGYTVDMISQNLKDCWEVGIYTEINWVIGVPGETDEDVREGIALILQNQKYIGRLANINPLILVNGGVYWIDPDAHNIVFKEPKEQLYAKFPRALPADSWYSTNPYIDAQVRKERFEHIVIALHDAGFNVGAWAHRVIEDVKLARDPHRAAGGKKALAVSETAEEGQALDASSAGVPLAEESARSGKVIPIRSAEGVNSRDDAKPPAEPPLFGIAGEPPRLVRKMETHAVVFHNGWYYGIPHAVGEVDLTNPEVSRMPGIIRHATEDEVVGAIEESARWADTRGHYDAQKKQRAAGSYMRAASAVGESELGELPDKPKILRFREDYIAVNQQALKGIFTTHLFRLWGRSGGGESDAQVENRPLEIQDGSLLRRMAGKLPPSVQHKIRCLIRRQSLSHDVASAPLTAQSDGRLLGMFWRALVDDCVKTPFVRLFSGANAVSTVPVQDGIPVKGEDFCIVSVVTKNALPELMWTIDKFNLVKFDGMFFGLPQGVPIDWDAGDVASIPGVVVGKTIKEAVSMIESKTQTRAPKQAERTPINESTNSVTELAKVPMLLGVIGGYNVVSYEGWIYGLPQDLGPVDLTEVDVMEMSGVIRDVSRDVVENEIMDRLKIEQHVA